MNQENKEKEEWTLESLEDKDYLPRKAQGFLAWDFLTIFLVLIILFGIFILFAE